MSLAEEAFKLAVAAREKVKPVDLFREDMLRAAHKGLFSTEITLGPQHGSVEFFSGVETQDYFGDSLAAEGVRIAFGEPVKAGGYPTVKLDWYKTRSVVKWSKVVRQEKSVQHYQSEGPKKSGQENVGNKSTATPPPQHEQEQRAAPAKAGNADVASVVAEESTKERKRSSGGSGRFEEKAARAGASFDSQAVANAIRERREEEQKKSPRPSREDIRKQTNEKAMQAVLKKSN